MIVHERLNSLFEFYSEPDNLINEDELAIQLISLVHCYCIDLVELGLLEDDWAVKRHIAGWELDLTDYIESDRGAIRSILVRHLIFADMTTTSTTLLQSSLFDELAKHVPTLKGALAALMPEIKPAMKSANQ